MFYAEINCRCLPTGNMSGYILSFSFGDDDDDDDVFPKMMMTMTMMMMKTVPVC